MNRYIICFLTILAIFLLFKGLLEANIRRIGLEIQSLDSANSAYHVQHSSLILQKQELLRRDRIINYAQQNLGMHILKADQIANGTIIKEIKEIKAKKDATIYAFIDDFNPTVTTAENKKK